VFSFAFDEIGTGKWEIEELFTENFSLYITFFFTQMKFSLTLHMRNFSISKEMRMCVSDGQCCEAVKDVNEEL
jgi:hypothetical protein